MTEHTHDLAGLTFLFIAGLIWTPEHITLVTLFVVVIVNQIGSTFPDLDQPTAEFYRELPAGSILGQLFSPLLGGHRHISHSILGICLYSWLIHLLLVYLGQFVLVDMDLVWYSFILGYLSHLVMDSLTKEGVPWFFPIPIRFGFPPFRFLRITTGKFLEHLGIYPGLIALNAYIFYQNYSKVSEFFSGHIIK